MNQFTYPILVGIVSGMMTRLIMLKTDSRQYPTRLHGKIVHLAMGFIAATLGAVAIPSIMSKDFSAITFLTLAASQFRDVRNMERNTLQSMDAYELVPRGHTYIEGIALVFESRNYLVILTSLVTTFAYLALNSIYAALGLAALSFFLSKRLMAGKKLCDIAQVDHIPLHFEGAGLYIDTIYIMNIGLPARQKEILQYGMGFLLTPKSSDARITLANLGQRQAILHDVSVGLGVIRDAGTPSLVPLAKLDLNDGRVGVFVLPQERDITKAIRVIENAPTLENAIRMSSKAGREKPTR